MPEDIYFDENFITEYDEVGDIRTVRDRAFVKQAVATSVIEYTPDTPVGFTPTAIEDRRSAIEEATRDNRFTEPPIAVTVEKKDQSTREVTFRVETNRVSFPITQ
jgi:hypothetical protein